MLGQEPDFAPGLPSALAAAFRQLSLESRAKEAARCAFELVCMSGEERLLARARHHEAQAQWTQAIESWRMLVECFPDNVDYGSALATAQVAAGRTREAQETLRVPAAAGAAGRGREARSASRWRP